MNPFYHYNTYETTDAVITNAEGETIFELKDVVFPSSWSRNARNIVASKYFYEGETDVRDLVRRVVDTIAAFGDEKGYFDNGGGVVKFQGYLEAMLLNQYASFNSPVWFNVGLGQVHNLSATEKTQWGWNDETKEVEPVDPYHRPQASACFIISVEDSIEDIWKLMAESAQLFKYGSGVGADWSKLRSTQEFLSGGGSPSGPVSFMRVQDATANTIKSGGKTRRAAIMQTLSVHHPDIYEFINAKTKEEKKAWALIEAGYDGSFNGEAYGTVGFQNVNQSVRVSNWFMRAVTNDDNYSLMTSKGDVIRDINAREVLKAIAEATHLCGDPGIQFKDTIDQWHTCPSSGNINSSNPCSEYMFLDNTACNLASINLKKFIIEKDGQFVFDTDKFLVAVQVLIIAQDILVDLAGYPSKEIARNSHKFRTLGLGYANLGATLMTLGLPYDSDAGRAFARGVTALMQAQAYNTSAKLAERLTPFEGYEDATYCVIEDHAKELDTIPVHDHNYIDLRAHATFQNALDRASEYGVRNAQVSVIAPTGTIAFMMDCDTTGIEPDLALVKYKLLAGEGEGVMKIVNDSVSDGLITLGYTDDQIEEIEKYILETGTIEGAPHVKERDLPVFDCSFKPEKGERFISHTGHIGMMAAVQPFISGAISKTVNMPEDSTVEDIFDAYVLAWKSGLKAIAIYRENSKRSQPLSVKKESAKGTGKSLSYAEIMHPEKPTTGALGEDDLIQDVKPKLSLKELAEKKWGETDEEKSLSSELSDFFSDDFPFRRKAIRMTSKQQKYISHWIEDELRQPRRKKLNDQRMSVTHKFSVAGHEGYIHAGLYEDGTLGEIFVRTSKEGSTISGLMDAFATSISLGLQYGVPLVDLVNKFKYTRFEPAGFTSNPDIRQATSVIDYIFKWLETQFLNPIGVSPGDTITAGDEEEEYTVISVSSNDAVTAVETEEPVTNVTQATPLCSVCGSITQRSGTCYSCPSCGNTTGCG